MEVKILYKVQTDLDWLKDGSSIKEVGYTKKTDCFYYELNGNRTQLDTTYSKCFETKQEAVDYLKSRINNSIQKAEENLNYAISHLDSLNKHYNNF